MEETMVDTTNEEMPKERTRRNAQLLFDLENFKIAWQSHYRTILSYLDLCALVSKMEEIHHFNVVSIKFYGTALSSMQERATKLSTELKDRFLQCSPTTNMGRLQLLTINRIVHTCAKETRAYARLFSMIKEDEANTQDIDLAEDFTCNQDANYDAWFSRLGGRTMDEAIPQRRCKVELLEFELKWHEGRRIQRGCDTAIVMDVVHAAEHSDIDSVILMSGDSDFIQTMQQSKKRSDAQQSDDHRPTGPKSFSMCSYLASFPIDIKKLFAIHMNESNIMSAEGIEYCRLEKAFPEINPQNPNNTQDEAQWLKRTPIPAGFYDSDLNLRTLRTSKGYRVEDELISNYSASLKRIEQMESKKGPKIQYKIGKLKVADLLRGWTEPEAVRTVSPPTNLGGGGGPSRSLSRPRESVPRTHPYAPSLSEEPSGIEIGAE